MFAVSNQFLTALTRPHTVATTCTFTPAGGTATTFTVSSGNVSVDRSQRVRRTASILVRGGSALYDQLSNPGTRVAIDHGIVYSGTDRELVPMIRGELSLASLQLGDGFIQIGVADLWQVLVNADFINPYNPPTSARRIDQIIAAVQAVLPTVTIRNFANDSGTVGTVQAWTSRADMITALAADGGTEAFFAPDGTFVLRDLPTINNPVAWLIKTGPGGTLENLTRSRPLDRVYNAVILTPASADPAQTWTQVVAQITDLNNPRHPSRLGRVVPFRYASPTLLTEADATRVAAQLLVKVQGSTETLSLGALSNPALEAGDIVRVLTPIDGGNTIVNHFLDSMQIDLVTGSMSCGTRANDELS